MTYTDNGGHRRRDIDQTLDGLWLWLVSDADVAMINSAVRPAAASPTPAPRHHRTGHRPDLASLYRRHDHRCDPRRPLPDDDPHRRRVTDSSKLDVTAAPPPPPDPDGRFLLAFDDALNVAYPTWTRIDSDRQPRHLVHDRPGPQLRARPHRHRPRHRPGHRHHRGPRPHHRSRHGGDSLLLETGGDELLLEDAQRRAAARSRARSRTSGR